MKRDELRLECLKLVHRHDRAPCDVVLAARIYEEYLVEPEADSSLGLSPDPVRGRGRPKKVVGEAENLDRP